MRAIVSTATGVANQSIDQCFGLLTEIEKYPNWYPDGAKSVTVLERDPAGEAQVVDAILAAVAGPLRKNFEVRLQVQTEKPTKVAFARIPDARGDHEALTISWQLASFSPEQTEITLEMTAYLDVPPFLPIGQVAKEAANGFLQAALTELG